MNSNVLPKSTGHVLWCLWVMLLGLSFIPGAGHCDYYTPGTGETLTLDQLVAGSGGVVTGASPYYQFNEHLIIREGDTLSIIPAVETAIAITSNVSLVISGTLQVQGTEDSPVIFTGMDQNENEWGGIYVEGNGSINMAYAEVSFAESGIFFYKVFSSAKGSIIDHCLIQGCDGPGIVVRAYDAPTWSLTNSVVAASGDAGLWLEDIGKSAVNVQGNWFWDNAWSGVFIYGGNPATLIQNNIFTGNEYFGIEVTAGGHNLQILNNLILENFGIGIGLNTGEYWLKEPFNTHTAGEQAVIQSNAIIGNQDQGIYSYYSSGHNIAYNTIADNSKGIHLQSTWNDLIAINTIGACTLDETVFSLDAMDLPFDYGETVTEQYGATFDDYDAPANSESGVFMEDSIPGLGAEPVSYGWIEVNVNNADNWMASLEDVRNEAIDNEFMDEAAIGFDFPVSYTVETGVSIYTHFSMNSNGVVELATQQGATQGFWRSGGRGSYLLTNRDYTFLFANADDWTDTGVGVHESHNGEQVRMNGFGYRYFQAGEADGDGHIIPEKCLVFRWYMQSWGDVDFGFADTSTWSDFQAVLYPDGRIKWNTRAQNAHWLGYSAYCGLYAGQNQSPFEIMGGNNPQSQSSFLFDPSKARDISNQIVGNTMINNGANSKQQLKAPVDDPDPGELGNIGLYEAFFIDMRSNTLESDALCLQLTGEGVLSATANFNNITSYGDYERRAPASGWVAVDNNASGYVDAIYNYWETDNPASYMDGDVYTSPWLQAAVPGPEEAGILVFHPFEVDSNGTVITVTSGTYAGMSMVVPLGALDDQEEPARKAAGTGTTFTMGELLPVPELPSYIKGVGIPFVFTPSGQMFNVPVTITMPYTGFVAPTDVYYYDAVNNTWNSDGISVVSVDQITRTVTFTTTHFSVFAAGLSKSAGAGDEDDLPYHYHRAEWADDHFIDCFVDGLTANGGTPFLPAALVLLLASVLGMRRKKYN